jgi:hypothetical protein
MIFMKSSICCNLFQEKFKEDVDVFDKHVREFLEIMKANVGDECMNSKMHSLFHVTQDLKNFACQLYANSAYIFENSLSNFKKWLRSGNRPLQQIK